HVHHQEAFDEFARQPLLPRKLGQSGPGVAWFDLDGDGWEDLAVASGKGGPLALFHNQQGKGFVRETNAWLAAPVPRSQTTVLGWRRGPGLAGLLAGAASYEDGDDARPGADLYDLAAQRVSPALPGH